MTQTHIRKQKHQLTVADATHATDTGFATVTPGHQLFLSKAWGWQFFQYKKQKNFSCSQAMAMN